MIDERKILEAVGLTERSVCIRLSQLAQRVPAGQAIVELGAFKGRTTGWLALGSSRGKKVPVYSIDPWTDRDVADWPEDYNDGKSASGAYSEPETKQQFVDHMIATGASELVEMRQGFATEQALIYDGPPIGLLFHDAEHTREAVAADLNAWVGHMAPGSTIVLHDAGNPGFGVVDGAEEILNNSGWDWKRRHLIRWRTHPERRGILMVKRA